MIILTMSLILVLLAFFNAMFSQPTADFVLREDEKRFLPAFFKSEAFVRSCLINLSFAGISIAIASSNTNEKDWYYAWFNPPLAVLLNLISGFLVSFSLKNDRGSVWDGPRRKGVVVFIIFAAILFIYAVATSANREASALADSPNPKFSAETSD